MSGLHYETVSRFAQQGGSIYFVILFLAGSLYGLWPKNKEIFDHLARLPLEDDENDHV